MSGGEKEKKGWGVCGLLDGGGCGREAFAVNLGVQRSLEEVKLQVF